MKPKLLRTVLLVGILSASFTGCFGKGAVDAIGVSTQREFWQSQNAKNYSYVSSHSCECTPNFATALRATVRNNVMTALVVESTGQAVPLNYRPTIEGLFDFIDTEQRTRPSLLEVTYHSTLGYPTRIKYGTPANDGGGIITVTSLSVTP